MPLVSHVIWEWAPLEGVGEGKQQETGASALVEHAVTLVRQLGLREQLEFLGVKALRTLHIGDGEWGVRRVLR
jgi:hypothetical protein